MKKVKLSLEELKQNSSAIGNVLEKRSLQEISGGFVPPKPPDIGPTYGDTIPPPRPRPEIEIVK